MIDKLRHLFAPILFVIVCVACVVAYAPGLKGVFVFDSVERVVRNETLRIDSPSASNLVKAAYAAQVQYPQRGLAYITLALNYYLSGERFDAYAFKLTNLLIHLLNGLLVWILCRMVIVRWVQFGTLTTSPAIATYVRYLPLFAAALWLLHPIQLTSVLYVVQRMTSLSGTWVFAGSILFLIGRTKLEDGGRFPLTFMYLGIVGGTGVGFLCKQNALLLPAFSLILEIFLFNRGNLTAAQRRRLAWFYGITFIAPLLLAMVVMVMTPERIFSGYDQRAFGIYERLLTQARVLFFYLGLMMLPDVRSFALYHDDIATSVGLLEPWTTALSLGAWAGVLALLAWGARRSAPWAFAVAWFLVGHAMESSVFPLELVHEHRNYVPSLGVWMSLAYYSGCAMHRSKGIGRLVLSGFGVWLLVLAFTTNIRAGYWKDPATLMDSLARNHPQSYRAAIGAAFNSIPRDADVLVRFEAFKRAAMLEHQVVVPLIQMARISEAVRVVLRRSGEVPTLAGRGNVRISVEDMQLRAHLDDATRLLGALDVEIQARLSNYAVRTDSVIALVKLVDCIVGGSDPCAGLSKYARDWHEAAIANPSTARTDRAVLELSVAKLYTVAGLEVEAVEHARNAGKLAPENLSYRKQEALLYALLGRWQAVGELLEEVETRWAWRVESDPEFHGLRIEFERSRSSQSQ